MVDEDDAGQQRVLFRAQGLPFVVRIQFVRRVPVDDAVEQRQVVDDVARRDLLVHEDLEEHAWRQRQEGQALRRQGNVVVVVLAVHDRDGAGLGVDVVHDQVEGLAHQVRAVVLGALGHEEVHVGDARGHDAATQNTPQTHHRTREFTATTVRGGSDDAATYPWSSIDAIEPPSRKPLFRCFNAKPRLMREERLETCRRPRFSFIGNTQQRMG